NRSQHGLRPCGQDEDLPVRQTRPQAPGGEVQVHGHSGDPAGALAKHPRAGCRSEGIRRLFSCVSEAGGIRQPLASGIRSGRSPLPVGALTQFLLAPCLSRGGNCFGSSMYRAIATGRAQGLAGRLCEVTALVETHLSYPACMNVCGAPKDGMKTSSYLTFERNCLLMLSANALSRGP